jgi:hypothetical protein
MKNPIVSSLLPMITVATLGAFAGSAEAAVNGPGFEFKAVTANDVSCFSRSSYGGLVNNCSTAKEVTATLPITAEGWYATTVTVYGSNSWCQSVSTDGFGNGAHVGPAAWISGASKTWLTLDTGSRYVWATTPLVFRCWLESGGIIGQFSAQ